MLGGSGRDVVYGGGGRDVIYAGSGRDAIYAGEGSDRIFGGAHADVLFSRDGSRDYVNGGRAIDRGQVDRDRLNSVETFFPPAPRGPLLLAAGDIASCSSRGDEATVALLDAYPTATVAALGDLAYESGTLREFRRCYRATWGRAKERTRPTPGNHEYQTPGAAGYFRYFGRRAGDPGKGYYGYNLGRWHVIALNSNCAAVGCSAGSAQEQWLRAELARRSARCTLAYWHEPLFSSGAGERTRADMRALFHALHERGADVVLTAHHHIYERFAPQDASGNFDPEGIRQFIVGTGGKSHHRIARIARNSQVRNAATFGVLRLTLNATSYAWHFVADAGSRSADSGTATCS